MVFIVPPPQMLLPAGDGMQISVSYFQNGREKIIGNEFSIDVSYSLRFFLVDDLLTVLTYVIRITPFKGVHRQRVELSF